MEQLLIKLLATWRLTEMLMNEDGPYNVIPEVKYKLGVRHNENGVKYGVTEAGRALVCPYCTSFWLGILFTFLPLWVATPFALSAGWVLIKKYHGKS